jgi:hypothetical protein
MLVLYLPAVKLGKIVPGKEGLQHSGTTNVILVSCKALRTFLCRSSTVGSRRTGRKGRSCVGDEVSRIRTSITGEYNTAIYDYIYIYTSTFTEKKENLDLFYDVSPPILNWGQYIRKLDLHI